MFCLGDRLKYAVFRVDASHAMGLGHLYRCMTLAAALTERKVTCIFQTTERPGLPMRMLNSSGYEWHSLGRQPDVPVDSEDSSEAFYNQWMPNWQADADDFIDRTRSLAHQSNSLVIVDHYGAGAEWHSQVRDAGYRVAAIDDLMNRFLNVNLLVDFTPVHTVEYYSSLVPADTELLVGSEYTLLRPGFGDAGSRRICTPRVSRILVNFGATDPMGLTMEVVQHVLRATENADIVVVTTSSNPQSEALKKWARNLPRVAVSVDVVDMPGLLATIDLAIGGGGVSAWERCAAGVPGIVVPFERNQEMVAESVRARGAAEVLSIGNLSQLAFSLQKLMASADIRERMSRAGRELCDGKGTERVVRAIETLFDVGSNTNSS